MSWSTGWFYLIGQAHEDEALQRRAEGVHGDSLIWMRKLHAFSWCRGFWNPRGDRTGQPSPCLRRGAGGRPRKRALEEAAEGERLQAEKQERLALGARLLALLKRFGGTQSGGLLE